ncbi:uncharacterized protein LOC128397946 [Panonychus citri]|uniref:uncharacterized protein LOC128397946 n=1 Tax=Panonychus citri TaxID=50023 RepID=UPI0023072A29|nr:uncharacterized protein LOC128397946 [Panonychus citri]XP_053214718.1 uncharacterized protein LOC128397946 [Panonychus citri]
MNFMGGGRRAMKAMEKENDQDKEKVINYIQKKMDEKTELESNGQSIFKANDKEVVSRSQDVIKAQVIKKIYAKQKQNQPIVVRHVLMEKPSFTLDGVATIHSNPFFKAHRKSMNWENRLFKTIKIEKKGRSENENQINRKQSKSIPMSV